MKPSFCAHAVVMPVDVFLRYNFSSRNRKSRGTKLSEYRVPYKTTSCSIIKVCSSGCKGIIGCIKVPVFKCFFNRSGFHAKSMGL